jgi:cytochrome c oxidase subunit 2
MMENLLGMPINASAHGAQIDRLIFLVHVLMLVLFVGWTAFFIYTLVRFRRSRSPRADYTGVKSHASSYLEAVIAVLEIALLVGLSIPFWSWKVSAFPTEPNTVHIRVIGQQFAWNVHYPGPDGVFGKTDIKLVNEQTNPIGLDRSDPSAKDDITTVNQLHIPVNRPLIIELTTKDVIHSFFLPVMRVKQDTIPGMIIPIHFRATQTSDQLREELARTMHLPTEHKLDTMVAMQDYAGKDGAVILKKDKGIKDEQIKQLLAAGISEIRVGPRYSAEIACAQLCGLGHYRMKGFLTIHEEADYDKWLKEQLEDLEQ